VKILNEPITVREERTTITTVFMGRCGKALIPKSGDLPMYRLCMNEGKVHGYYFNNSHGLFLLQKF